RFPREQPPPLGGGVRAALEARARRCAERSKIDRERRRDAGVENHLPLAGGIALPDREEDAVALAVRLRRVPCGIGPGGVAEIVTARDAGLRGLPFELQRERVFGRRTRAPFLTQARRLRLEHDAVCSEVGEER